jgi:hypothetical protein
VADRIPLMDYLFLDPKPHLVAQECEQRSVRYFGRRNACTSGFGFGFASASAR